MRSQRCLSPLVRLGLPVQAEGFVYSIVMSKLSLSDEIENTITQGVVVKGRNVEQVARIWKERGGVFLEDKESLMVRVWG